MATVRDYESAVQRKLGCALSGKKHQKWTYRINGRLVGWSMRSHGLRPTSQLSDRTLGDMAREMRCTLGTWKRVVDCPGTLKEYLDDLLSAGVITLLEYNAALQ